jgi:uncharacterized repeat protein (TIGR04138 family)
MKQVDFQEALKSIMTKDPRYAEDAYTFLREALDYTLAKRKKENPNVQRHVKGQELLDGIRRYAIHEFGPMSRRVLNEWGIQRTEDFGTLVFHLVDTGVLGKSDEDRIEDFSNGYSFDDAFDTPFLPASKRKTLNSSNNIENV